MVGQGVFSARVLDWPGRKIRTTNSRAMTPIVFSAFSPTVCLPIYEEVGVVGTWFVLRTGCAPDVRSETLSLGGCGYRNMIVFAKNVRLNKMMPKQ